MMLNHSFYKSFLFQHITLPCQVSDFSQRKGHPPSCSAENQSDHEHLLHFFAAVFETPIFSLI
jgi:hypothetical protein